MNLYFSWLLHMDQEFQRSEPGYPDSADSFWFCYFRGVSSRVQFCLIFSPASIYTMPPSCLLHFIEVKPALRNLLCRDTASAPVPFLAAYAD